MKSLFFYSCIFLFPLSLFAELTTSRLFSDHCVLQRDREIPVWGWASPGDKVKIEFAGQTVYGAADKTGEWQVTLQPLKMSSNGQTMIFLSDNGEKIEYSDVVVGDVWVCSGQSNMGFPLKASLSKDRVFANPDKLIRFFAPGIEFYPYPLERFKSSVAWEATTAKSLAWKSAVAYYFAEAVRKEVDVPIGLYLAARGGTMIQPFMPVESHAMLPDNPAVDNLKKTFALRDPALQNSKDAYTKKLDDIDRWLNNLEESVENGTPFSSMPALPGDGNDAGLYNTFFAPMERFPVKGMIWYQGESNGGDGVKYTYLLDAFIKSVRKKFNGDGAFPFYIVQLANFGADKGVPGLGDGNVGVREAQREVAMTLPNCGLAVTHDIGNPKDVHPKNKLDVGKRLARWALNRDYGKKDILVSGPVYKSQKIDGNKIIISFDYVGSGLMVGKKDKTNPTEEIDAPLERFAIAGADKKFVRADAKIIGDTVVVSSPEIPSPKYVRYAYSASPTGCNLYNREGLPASPFKTDPWQE